MLSGNEGIGSTDEAGPDQKITYQLFGKSGWII